MNVDGDELGDISRRPIRRGSGCVGIALHRCSIVVQVYQQRAQTCYSGRCGHAHRTVFNSGARNRDGHNVRKVRTNIPVGLLVGPQLSVAHGGPDDMTVGAELRHIAFRAGWLGKVTAIHIVHVQTGDPVQPDHWVVPITWIHSPCIGIGVAHHEEIVVRILNGVPQQARQEAFAPHLMPIKVMLGHIADPFSLPVV